jgi:hypothetical protein
MPSNAFTAKYLANVKQCDWKPNNDQRSLLPKYGYNLITRIAGVPYISSFVVLSSVMGAGASVTSVEEVTALDETLQREKADALFARLDVVADGKLNLMEIKKGFEALEEEGVVVNVSAQSEAALTPLLVVARKVLA